MKLDDSALEVYISAKENQVLHCAVFFNFFHHFNEISESSSFTFFLGIE